MARQTVREHTRLTTGRQVASYDRRDARSPKPRSASLMSSARPSGYFAQAPAARERST